MEKVRKSVDTCRQNRYLGLGVEGREGNTKEMKKTFVSLGFWKVKAMKNHWFFKGFQMMCIRKGKSKWSQTKDNIGGPNIEQRPMALIATLRPSEAGSR